MADRQNIYNYTTALPVGEFRRVKSSHNVDGEVALRPSITPNLPMVYLSSTTKNTYKVKCLEEKCCSKIVDAHPFTKDKTDYNFAGLEDGSYVQDQDGNGV